MTTTKLTVRHAERVVAIWVLCRYGLRVDELVALAPDDISVTGLKFWLQIVKSKTLAGRRTPRMMPGVSDEELKVASDALALLKREATSCGSPYLFFQLRNEFVGSKAAASQVRNWVGEIFSGAHPHSLRRFYASVCVILRNCLGGGEELVELLKDLGHATDETIWSNYVVCPANLRMVVYRVLYG